MSKASFPPPADLNFALAHWYLSPDRPELIAAIAFVLRVQL